MIKNNKFRFVLITKQTIEKRNATEITYPLRIDLRSARVLLEHDRLSFS